MLINKNSRTIFAWSMYDFANQPYTTLIITFIYSTFFAKVIAPDEIDKIARQSSSHGPDVSREGVQRDILPIVEGSTVTTKYGLVKTEHILFIAAGAFHVSKVSDLIPKRCFGFNSKTAI